MQRNGLQVSDEQLDNLQKFVDLYSVFSNDIDLTGNVDENEKTLFDWLKKYKLASSEGLNKHTNRMIRFNVMKDFMFGISRELSLAETTLLDKMKAASIPVEEDPEE